MSANTWFPRKVGVEACDLPQPAGRGRSQSGCDCYSGSANAKSALPCRDPSIAGRNPSAQPPNPVGTATYCRPSTLYVLGLLWWPLPHWNFHNRSPVSALRALNLPEGSPANTRLPCVASTEAHIGCSLRQRQVSWPVLGSNALIDP